MTDTQWMTDANCRGTNPNLFYEPHHRHQALALCAQCPVQTQCANHANTTGEQHGIWGADTSRLANRHRHHRNQFSDTPSATQLILDTLDTHRWITPHAIAQRTGLMPNTVQKRLSRLLAAGAPIQRLDGGYYRTHQEPT